MREVTVVYQDGMLDMVTPKALQTLIEADEIIKFQRTDGWAYLGVDPVRRLSRSGYPGIERRTL